MSPNMDQDGCFNHTHSAYGLLVSLCIGLSATHVSLAISQRLEVTEVCKNRLTTFLL